MKISPINKVGFRQVVETHRKDTRESNKEQETYEVTITYTEVIKVPKASEVLQQVDYVI